MSEPAEMPRVLMRLRASGSVFRFCDAGDHLLVVSRSSYGEVSRRFQYRDIQAFQIRANSLRLTWNILLGLLLALTTWALVGAVGSPYINRTTVWVLAILSLGWGAVLLVNSLLGQCGQLFLRTAVQQYLLPAPRRVRQARKLILRFEPMILSAQESIAAGEITRLAAESAVAVPPAPPPLPVTKRPYPLHLSLVLGGLMLAASLLAAPAILADSSKDLAVMSLTAAAGALAIAIIAVVHTQTTTHALVRWASGLSLTALAIGGLAMFVWWVDGLYTYTSQYSMGLPCAISAVVGAMGVLNVVAWWTARRSRHIATPPPVQSAEGGQ